MKTLSIALFCFVCGLTFAASFAFEDEAEVLNYAFTPPAYASDGTGTIFLHFLPTEDQFAPNINCIAQAFDGTLEDYDKISQNQFKQMGLTVVSAVQNPDHLIYEYHGKQQGFDMHFYSKAYKRGDMIYLITATGLHDKWEAHAKALLPAVESFKLQDKPNLN